MYSAISQKPSIAPRERAVALVGGATLVFSAWSFAGVMAWALHAMLIGGLLTLACAALPTPTFGVHTLQRFSAWYNGMDGEHSNSKNIKRLVLSPFFWLGFCFIAYLCLQAINPSMVRMEDERGWWWIEAIEPPLGTAWPSSIRANFGPMNAWRAIELHLAAGSLACGLWVGLRRRRAALAVLWAFVISGALLAMVAMLQHFSGADKVLWTVASENESFWGSFFYRNHGAAYINWVLVLTGCLYFYHAKRSSEVGQSGGPHFLCVFGFVLTVCSVGLALSRGGIIIASLLSAVYMLGILLQYLLGALSVRRSLAISLVLAALLAAGGTMAYRTIDWAAMKERFGEIGVTIENMDSDQRTLASRATWEMAQDKIWLGWGAGSFRYAFPKYQKAYPELWHQRYHHKKGWIGRKFFRYAHNDLLQFLAEYGIVGSSLLWAALLSLLVSGLRGLFSDPLVVVFLLFGLTCAFVHAFADFIFSCPAYWVAFVGGLALLLRFIVLEAKRSS
jgi:O-antigen ligase